MNRREVLLKTAGGMAILAGCTDESKQGVEQQDTISPTLSPTPTPTPSPTSSPTPSPTPDPRVQHLNQFRELLEGGIEVDFLAYQGGYDVVALDYISTATTREEVAEEMGIVIGAYTTMIKEGWEVSLLRVGILNRNKVLIGRWKIRTKWVREYLRGEISKTDLSARVLMTLESV